MPNYQLPEGYKQTEVGVIPEDWEVLPIGNIASIFVGKDVDESHFSTIQDDKYKFPVYSNTVDNEGLYGYYDYAEFSGESLTVIGRGVGLGTAFSRNGGFGAIGRLVAIFPTEKGHHRFLADYINHKIKIFSESSGVPQLTGIGLAQYPVALPPKKEQRAIATALSNVDALIAALDKLIAKQRHLKTATMQQLLTGKKRLPGFGEGKDYKQTEIGVIPEDWNVKRLMDVVDYVDYRGKTPPKQEVGVPLITARNIRDGYIDYEVSQEYVSPDEYDKIMSRGKPEIGDILITTEAPLGNVAAVDNEYIALAQRVIKYRTKDLSLEQIYLKHYLLSNKFQKNLQDNSSGSTAQGIKGSVLHTLPIVMMKPEEQHAIATVLSDMDGAIAALEARLAKTQAIKQGMMQQLLTGKVRLLDKGIDNCAEKSC